MENWNPSGNIYSRRSSTYLTCPVNLGLCLSPLNTMSMDGNEKAINAPCGEFSSDGHSNNGSGADSTLAFEYIFHIPQDKVAYLEDKLRMHGTSTQAMGKLLSRVVLQDIRRQVTSKHEFALQE